MLRIELNLSVLGKLRLKNESDMFESEDDFYNPDQSGYTANLHDHMILNSYKIDHSFTGSTLCM